MDTFEKLYTVEDVAKMTMLTTRTIRNYLKEGLLSGRKVGGQWRFTRKDIEALFENSSVEIDIKNSRRQEVMDFLDGVNTDMDGDIQICTIADYYCEDIENSKRLSDKMSNLISDIKNVQRNRLYYEYIEKESKARYTVFGAPAFVSKILSVMEEEWNRINISLDKFSGKAKNYTNYRPSYPQPLINFIYSKIGKPQFLTIADIGSGTGKMSRCLLNMGSKVYGIEPNEDMRNEAERQFSGIASFLSVNGTGENTTLQTDSVDAIVCAEAFHWFNNEKSKLEFKRILKQDGYVFLVWNTFGSENPYAQDIIDLNKRVCNKKNYNNIRVSKDEHAADLFGKNGFEKITFDNNLNQSFEALLGGMLSASYAPQKDDLNYEEYVKGINKIFEQYKDGDKIKTIFKSECYYGKLI